MNVADRLREAEKQLVLASDRLDDPRAALVGEHADAIRALAKEVEDAQESEIATDGGTTGYARCGDCGTTYPSLSAARLCCRDDEDDDGPEGTPLLADGGRLRVEAGCNCEHLPESATCAHCGRAKCRGGPGFAADHWPEPDDYDDYELITDGGQRAPRRRSDGSTHDPTTPLEDLEQRVEDVEEQLAENEQTIKDIVAMLNDLRGKA